MKLWLLTATEPTLAPLPQLCTVDRRTEGMSSPREEHYQADTSHLTALPWTVSQAQRCPSCPLSILLAALLGEDLDAASPRTLVWIISPPPHLSSSDSLSSFRLGSPCCLTCMRSVNPVRTHVGHGLALCIFPGMLWSSVVSQFSVCFS